MKISIIDYGMGNITSVANAMARLNCKVQITNDLELIKNSDGLILPGVGAFGKAVENLKSLNLFEPLKEVVTQQKKPILGICLGMQLLADVSYERGKFKGLGLIPGEVKKINIDKKNLLLPHVGWNPVKLKLNLLFIKKLIIIPLSTSYILIIMNVKKNIFQVKLVMVI